MKKIFLAFALFAGTASVSTITHAQIRVSFNIGNQPLWGPTGYDNVQYYYLPDIDAYYSVDRQQFIYNERGQWVFRPSLPPRYGNYDLYNGYKVVVNERDPWLRNSTYARQYRQYRGRRGQAVIRDSRDNRYWENANHPHHSEWRRTGAKSGDVQRVPDRQDNHRDDRRNDRRR